jgi:AcrR family transcriptional regulator
VAAPGARSLFDLLTAVHFISYEVTAQSMKLRQRQMAETRRAILEAVAAEIAEAGLTGFSIQGVADRAGVTHRTVYNHFPTREALNDAFAEHVEAVLAERGLAQGERSATAEDLPKLVGRLYSAVGDSAAYLRAYVMMTIATGKAARVFRDRSRKMEKLIDQELGPLDPGVARLVTAAVRMFFSSAGWFLLSNHHGLSPAEAERASQWAVKTLLGAAGRGDVPEGLDKREKKHA